MFKKINGIESIFALLAIFLLPTVAFADLSTLLDGMIQVVELIIPIILALAVLVFFWGLVKFISNAGDEKVIEEGKQLMIWGMIALFVMVCLWGILGFFQQDLGLDVGTGSLGSVAEQPDSVPVP